jgi:hypothetical protein
MCMRCERLRMVGDKPHACGVVMHTGSDGQPRYERCSAIEFCDFIKFRNESLEVTKGWCERRLWEDSNRPIRTQFHSRGHSLVSVLANDPTEPAPRLHRTPCLAINKRNGNHHACMYACVFRLLLTGRCINLFLFSIFSFTYLF